MVKYFKYCYSIFLFWLSAINFAFGAIEIKNARIEGTGLLSPFATLSVTDDKLSPAASAPTNYTIIGSKVLIEFGHDEEKRLSHPHTYKSVITFQYTPYNSSLSPLTPQTETLEIIYNPGESHTGGAPKNKAILKLSNYYKISISNISIVTTDLETSTTISNPTDLYLEAEIQTERYYDFDIATPSTTTYPLHSSMGINYISNSTPKNYELEFYWDYVLGAENYELEYIYLNDYDATLSSSIGLSSIKYDFRYNATRIITKNQFYRIPTTFERGYIIFRVRAVSKNSSDPLIRLEGRWSITDVHQSGTLNTFQSNYPSLIYQFSVDGSVVESFENEKNWVSTLSFDENGKKGSSITFLDGLLNNRQTITRLNHDDKTIVQSTLYDFQGRPVINTLPSPIDSKDFFYKSNVNMFSSTIQYDKNIFDEPASGCSISGKPMSSEHSTGAANYFSSYSTQLNAQQGYVPESNGYPFVQVEYYPDQQGRIKRQSLPGNTHYLNSGRETKYIYVSPTQEELARMFGSEVGLESQYTKDVVIDPNGQISYSYVDDDGKVVATALGGESPNNVIALEDNTGTVALSQNLLLRNDPDPTDYSYTSTTSFFAAQGELNQSIEYSLAVTNFTDECLPDICFDCFYELEISIKDDCGNEILDSDNIASENQPYTVLVGSPIVVDINCEDPVTTFSLPTSPLTVNLPSQGVYHISKTLRLSTLALEEYALLYLQNNSCLIPLEDFQETAMNNLDLTGCIGTTCASCSTAVAEYVANHEELDATTISHLYHSCDGLCAANNPCESKRLFMLQQFRPGGQYAKFDVDANGIFYSTDVNSIFNPSNTLGTTATGTWNNPPVAYTTTVLNTSGNMVSPSSLTINEYISRFDISWAENLIKLHPEYCKLEFECSTDVLAANIFIQELSVAQSFDEACVNHLLIPGTGMGSYSGAPDSDGCGCGLTPNTYPSSYITSGLSSFTLPAVGSNPSIGTGTIYQYAMALARGVDIASLPSGVRMGDDDCLKDKEWSIFRGLMNYYHNSKIETNRANFISSYSGSGNCGAVPTGLVPVFHNVPSQLTDYLTAITTGSTPENPATTPSNSVQDNCESQCEAYVASWLEALKNGCFGGSTPSNWNDISAALVDVCIAGCDNYNPNGSSTTASGTIAVAGPSGSVNVSSFQDVLTAFGYGINASCSAYLISTPMPYGHSYSTATQTVPTLDKCGCDKILENHANYSSNCTTSESTFFENTYGYSVPNYSNLLCICDAAARENSANVSGGNLVFPIIWNNDALTALHDAVYTTDEVLGYSNIIFVPPALACDNCIECSVIANIEDDIRDVFGSTINISTINPNALLNFVNGFYNMNNSLEEWTSFKNDCDSVGVSNIYSSGFSATSDKILEMLNQFNQFSNGLSTPSGAIPFTTSSVPAFFSAGIYPAGTLSSVACQQFNFLVSTSGSNTTLTMSAGTGCSGVTSTQFTLIPITSGVAFSTDGHFYDLKWRCGEAANDPPRLFVKYDYLLSGTITTLEFEIIINSPSSIRILENQSIAITGAKCGPVLCSNSMSQPAPDNDCITSAVNNALNGAQTLYDLYVHQQVEKFKNDYKNHCFAQVEEEFVRNYDYREYHYTLYYYDQAGNLVHTVPPNGVSLLNATNTSDAINNILDPTNVSYPPVYPNHSINTNRTMPGSGLSDENTHYVTDYTYTSFNQPSVQTTPDGGKTTYWYDHVGRLTVSQNAKQYDGLAYSYTLYDNLGRISEVGMLGLNSSQTLTETMVKNPLQWAAFLAVTNKLEVTKTYYDEPLGSSGSLFGSSGQENTRNRVTAVTYENIDDNDPSTFDYASYYSYDDHGNVKHLIQDNVSLSSLGSFHRYKHVEYEYDLVSGNVNQVSYQKNEVDQFYHTYYYDIENRLHEVYTSTDGVIWDRDAKYFFYEHGPLARTEIGDKQIQGIDYAYTIQGWIKGINSTVLNEKNDIGKDAGLGSTYMSSFSSMHRYFAKDAASFNLNYYSGDYVAKNGITGTATDFIADVTNLNDVSATGFMLNTDGKNLYNGNISSMVTTVTDINTNDRFIKPQITAYSYDQLHRLKEMKAFSTTNFASSPAQAIDLANNAWEVPTSSNFKNVYASSLTYDKNGNILQNNRLGEYDITSSATKNMDELDYVYVSGTNKLNHVTDNITLSVYNDDIETQSLNNYEYDNIGQLSKDVSEEIDLIEWTNSRKIRSIIRNTSSTKDNLYFDYDPMGNRIRKTLMPQSAGVEDPDNKTIYHYVLDASGNQMSIYTEKYVAGVRTIITQDETPIFGSDRLGLVNYKNTRAVYDVSMPSPSITNIYEHQLGLKLYEVENHLGNVLTTFTDWKTAFDDNYYNLITGALISSGPDGYIDYYEPIINSFSDYYPFGAVMPGRSYNSSDAPHGFNGKRKDNEVYASDGTSYDFGARQYDSRLGRWWSTDPLTHSYPFASPYNFALNTPIQAVDPDGEKVLFVNGYYNSGSLSGVAGSEGNRGYWGGSFIKRASKFLGDNNAQFIDGRGKWNSTGAERLNAGYEWAKANYESLIQGVVDDKGVQTETFKVVSHSMGAAYSEGVIKYLEEKGLTVEKVVHLSPADPSGFKASPNPETMQLNYENDIVLGYKNFGEGGDMIQGVDMFGNVDTDEWFGKDFANSHARTKFSETTFNALEDLKNTSFEFKYTYSPTGRKADNFDLFKYSGGSNGTKFNSIFKGGRSYNIQNSKTATSKSTPRFQ